MRALEKRTTSPLLVEAFHELFNKERENICRELFVEAAITYGDYGDINILLFFDCEEISIGVGHKIAGDTKRHVYELPRRVFSSIFLKAEFIRYLGCKATTEEIESWKEKVAIEVTKDIEEKILKKENNIIPFLR